MKITKIQRQKNNPRRFNIYADGVFFTGMGEEEIVRLGLKEGDIIDKSVLLSGIREDEFLRALNKAGEYIGGGRKTQKQAEDYLAKTGIVNWPSNLCSLTGMGYTTAASATDVAYRLINKNLWAKIPETDVRKGWWVDEDLHSPVLDNGLGEDYAYYWANGMFNGGTFPSKFSPYTNVKFGPDNGTFADTDNAQDWPLMRVEEMKLIEAEALGRDNLATGKQKLEEFVRQYRDPSYTCTAGSLDAFIDEVWFQRRIELWGEGFALFDILRLKKPIIRQGANYPINSTFAEIAAEAPIMIYRIPEAETSVNSAITEADNNPAAMAPTPVN